MTLTAVSRALVTLLPLETLLPRTVMGFFFDEHSSNQQRFDPPLFSNPFLLQTFLVDFLVEFAGDGQTLIQWILPATRCWLDYWHSCWSTHLFRFLSLCECHTSLTHVWYSNYVSKNLESNMDESPCFPLTAPPPSPRSCEPCLGSFTRKSQFRRSGVDKDTWTSSRRHWSPGTRNSLDSHPWSWQVRQPLASWILSQPPHSPPPSGFIIALPRQF